MRTTPRSGTSSAFSERSTVVLPEPDGPMSTVTEPGPTSRSTPRRTWLSPKDLWSAGDAQQAYVATYRSKRSSRRVWANDMATHTTQ